MKYEIVCSVTEKVLGTIEGTWEEVKLKVLNRKGMYVRKVKKSPEIVIDPETNVYVDAWTSGNPGMGGYRVIHKGNEVVKWDSKEPHTNNYFELAAVGAGCKYLIEHGIDGVVWTDSATVLAWLKSGPADVKEKEQILAMLVKISVFLNNPLVRTRKWDTESWGEIPADFGRK